MLKAGQYNIDWESIKVGFPEGRTEQVRRLETRVVRDELTSEDCLLCHGGLMSVRRCPPPVSRRHPSAPFHGPLHLRGNNLELIIE